MVATQHFNGFRPRGYDAIRALAAEYDLPYRDLTVLAANNDPVADPTGPPQARRSPLGGAAAHTHRQ